MTVWQVGLAAAVAGFTWYFTRVGLRLHHGLGSAAFDFSLYDQGVWLLSRFQAPFVTVMGRNLFADHASFILLPLVPAYWALPGAGTLLFVQSAGIAAGAFPVFLYARRRLGSEAAALLLAVALLFHPALCWSTVEGFHPDALLSAFVGFALYGALTEKWRMYAVFVVLSALVKEDAWLVLVPLGAWVAWRRRPGVGLLTMAASTAYTLVAVGVVMPALGGVWGANAWRIPFGGPGGFLAEVVRRPGNVADYLRSEGRPWYLWQMTAPFAWAFLRVPEVAAIGAVVLFTNVASTFGYQHQIQYHYSVVVVPALALGTVHALGALRGRLRGGMLAVVVVMSLWTAQLWGPLPFARSPLGYWAPDHPGAVAAREVMADIPPSASVSAYYNLVPHLARRERVYMFPTPFRALLYGPGTSLEGQRLAAADSVEYVVLPASRDPDLEKLWGQVPDDFELVRANDWWELYRRSEGG